MAENKELFLADQVESANLNFVKMHLEMCLKFTQTATEEIDVVEEEVFVPELGKKSKVRFTEEKLWAIHERFMPPFGAFLNRDVEKVLKVLYHKGAIVYRKNWDDANKRIEAHWTRAGDFSQSDLAYAVYKTVGDYIAFDKDLKKYVYHSSEDKLSSASGLKKMFRFDFADTRTKLVQYKLPKHWEEIDSWF